jgi:nucleotide-binding universal stress UspA family protein
MNMFRKVLIGIDGRQGGRDAIALACELAAPHAALTLVHIQSSLIEAVTDFDRARYEQVLNDARDAVALEGVALEADTILEFHPSVGRGLHKLAEDQGADLLVVGSTHRALLGRVLLGDHCAGALNGSPCAIAVATRGYSSTPHAWERIGIGHNGSPESEHALAVAREIAGRHGARLKAFHVVSLPEVRDERPLPADWPKTIEALIARDTERLAQLPGVEALVSYGGTGEELVQLAGGVDLMVVGSRGFGPIGRLFYGSVSHYLVQHAKCPVLVLPRHAVRQLQVSPSGETPAATAASS